jgi:uncharacterized membrane protein (DUF4010 family)
MIASLLGGVSWALGGVSLLAIAFLGVAGLCAIGYVRTREQDPGLTTETTLLLSVLLGGYASKDPVMASALAVTVAMALRARTGIHHFIREVLSEQELTDALIFAAAALVVLPLVPDRYVGPFNAINPRPRNAGGVAEARGGGAFPFTARWACPRCAGGDIGTALRRNN